MEPRYQKYKDQGYQQYLVIQADANGPTNVAHCKKVRANNGNPLTFPVLYDPAGTLSKVYKGKTNEQHYVVGQGAVLLLKKQYAAESVVESLIEAELAK